MPGRKRVCEPHGQSCKCSVRAECLLRDEVMHGVYAEIILKKKHVLFRQDESQKRLPLLIDQELHVQKFYLLRVMFISPGLYHSIYFSCRHPFRASY